jgi:hypothetical protein
VFLPNPAHMAARPPAPRPNPILLPCL